jgi:uncharacterized membrane-anchored protein
MIKHPKLALALAFPIACLAVLTGVKQARVMMGMSFVIPIAGYDPRDLLAGHYLIFRLDLGNDICDQQRDEDAVLVCGMAEDGVMTSAARSRSELSSTPGRADDCTFVLRGRCEYGRFLAGVERFYVPEEHARALERAIGSKQGAVVVSIDRSGRAVVKDLLIDGKPWRKAIQDQPPR